MFKSIARRIAMHSKATGQTLDPKHAGMLDRLTSGDFSRSMSRDVATVAADEKRYQESKDDGLLGAVNRYVAPVVRAVGPYALAAGFGGALGFGPLAAASGGAASGGAASAALIESGTVGTAGAALETAAIGSTPWAASVGAASDGAAAAKGGMISTEKAILSGAPSGATLNSVAAPAGIFPGPGGGMAAGATLLRSGSSAGTSAARAVSSLSTSDALLATSALSPLMAPEMPEMPAPGEVPSREDVAAPRNRTEQMALRAQDLGRNARAAGAQRSTNAADLLGARGGARRRGEARRALSGL